MAVNWRVQENLKAITRDVKAKRPKATVYSVGDASHQSRASDHNPYNWGYGIVVSAIDIMIRNGFTKADGDAVLKELIGRSDIQYIIWNRYIYSRTYGWAKRRYYGNDPHTDHVHVSARHTSAADKDLRGLPKFLGKNVTPKPSKPAPVVKPPVKKPVSADLVVGSKGAEVKKLQTGLKKSFKAYAGSLSVDGDFGPATQRAVKEFQRRVGLKADGIVGVATKKALKKYGIELT